MMTIEAQIQWREIAANSGRAFFQGMKPLFSVRDIWITSRVHRLRNQEKTDCGEDEFLATIHLPYGERYLSDISIGSQFKLADGSFLIASGVVKRIVNVLPDVMALPLFENEV